MLCALDIYYCYNDGFNDLGKLRLHDTKSTS